MYPRNVMKVLRQRQGLESNDTSQDDQLNNLKPLEALEEMATWELGSQGWSRTFIYWAESCGLEIKEKE